jgi:KaiC/GvpD/RAD55 family RecA-like ATPase
MSRFGWKVDRYESGSKFQIVDAVSPARLGSSANMGRGALGLDPTGMLILVTEQLKQAESERNSSKLLIVIDSVSRLLLACETKSVIDFVSCLSSRLESYQTKGIATVAEGAHDNQTLSALTFSSNGTIRFKIIEEGENRYRQLRLEALRGRKHDDRWKNYMITSTGFDMEI